MPPSNSRTDDASVLHLCISPAGHPYLGAGDDATRQPTPLENRLYRAFSSDLDYCKGLLHLATTELETPLAPDFDFLRHFAKIYLTRLCHLPELGTAPLDGQNVTLPPVPVPSVSEREFWLVAAPPLTGSEYLTADVLATWWRDLDRYVHDALGRYAGSPADWIRRLNPLWKTVGRVTFHLAENKRDERRPFAFLATYTDKVSAAAKPIQVPLSKALTEYASAKDRQALLRLLQPITLAAEQCPWLQTMVDEGTVYQPRAWTPRQAYQLLQDIPALEEAGLIVRVPDWWNSRRANRPRVRVNIGTSNDPSLLSASSLLDFRIAVVLGDDELTEAELAELQDADAGLVRLNGQWVEVDRDKLQATLEHWQKIDDLVHQDGLTFYEGMRLLSGVPIDGKWNDVDGENAFRNWSDVMPIGNFAETLRTLRDPADVFSSDNIGLRATLRPYQETGVRWLDAMSRLGLGACLADDMGLGKTIQVIAVLLAHRKSRNAPSLLVAPASLLANWESEIRRFAPSLKTYIAHSSGSGTQKPKNLNEYDLVMTTYGMAGIDWITKASWQAVVLDEAQAIKNAGTKQAKAVKSLKTRVRIALTGTPIENRLSDLWSLFDFLNPGLLGSGAGFSKFVKSIQKREGSPNYAPLRKLTRPYILRRLKTDKSIISDLPDKTEVTAWCPLAKKQAMLYQKSVERLSKDLKENAEGIKRRGVILAYLMRLKQICNHPAQWTGDGDYDPARSGKFERLKEICDEIASRQEKVLVFTQFREITTALSEYLRTIFRRPGLILDGNTPVKKRKEMVDAFQSPAGPPFFVLSLKAGGTGLNLTAASHVVHFDRWWNPAVENQATDRAFRIGQNKNVLVHKFVCRGTIEERIDEMIESKKSLARDVVEAGGEALVTEMSDEQLLSMVALDLDRAT